MNFFELLEDRSYLLFKTETKLLFLIESKVKLMLVLHSELLFERKAEGQFSLMSHLSFIFLKLKSKFLFFES